MIISLVFSVMMTAPASGRADRGEETIPVIDPAVYETLAALPDIHQGATPRIAHISDIHHFAPSLYDPDSEIFARFAANNEGRTILHTTLLMESLKADLLDRGVSSLLLTGDMTVWGGKVTHEDMARILADFEEAGIEVFVTPGNHDILNLSAGRLVEGGKKEMPDISPEDFPVIYGAFGFDQALLKQEETLSYLADLDDRTMVLSLNSAYYEDNYFLGYAAAPGILREEQYDFAREALALARKAGKEVIVMTHHNFIKHYEIDRDLKEFMVNDDERMLSLLKEEGVVLGLSGHIHKSDIKKDGDSAFHSVAAGSLSIYPHSYRLISTGQDAFALSTVELPLLGPQPEAVEEYNRALGYERTFSGQLKRLEGEYTEKQARAMARYFYQVNLYAQQGLEAYLPSDIADDPGLALFMKSSSQLKGFARILPLDSYPDDRNARVPFE